MSPVGAVPLSGEENTVKGENRGDISVKKVVWGAKVILDFDGLVLLRFGYCWHLRFLAAKN